MSSSRILVVALHLTGVIALAGATPAQQPIRVFVLAGQSNMEGKAQNELLERQARAPETKELFAHWREGDAWRVRDDVFIQFLERRGGLTIGYGTPGRTGPELELGAVLGEHFEEPVVLVKAAWGGHSLFEPFRPPSAGMPSDEVLSAQVERMRAEVEKRNAKGRDDPLPTRAEVEARYGSSYREMLREVRAVLADCGALFPELAGGEPELAGFVWFQGWNDQYHGAELEYESNLKHLITDVRRDLKAPELPVVIAVMGQNGSQPAEGAMRVIQEAQLAMEQVPEFAGNVKAVRTDVLVDEAAEALYPTWKENVEAWEQVGSDHPYHYLGSAIWYGRIGRACGQALIELDAGG